MFTVTLPPGLFRSSRGATSTVARDFAGRPPLSWYAVAGAFIRVNITTDIHHHLTFAALFLIHRSCFSPLGAAYEARRLPADAHPVSHAISKFKSLVTIVLIE